MAKLTEEQKLARAKTKEENLKKQEQERLEGLRQSRLSDLRKKPLPDPKFSYTVGERVSPRTASFDYMIIKEILDGGKILLCEIHCFADRHGLSEIRLDYLSHLDVLPENYELMPTISFRDENYMHFNNSELFSLLTMYYSSGIDTSPVYQRELCWSLEDKQRLIGSIFNNIEIGKFAFIELPYNKDGSGHSYEILDGKQRLNAIIEFYEDGFEYESRTFSQMSNRDKSHFQHYSVTLGRGRETMTLKDKMEYFIRMNTTGVPQSEDHLEKVKALIKKEKSE